MTPSKEMRAHVEAALAAGDLTVDQRAEAAKFFLGEMHELRAIVEMLGAPERPKGNVVDLRRRG